MNRKDFAAPEEKLPSVARPTLAWLGYCRPGFERDLTVEFDTRRKRATHGEVIHADDGAGFVVVDAQLPVANAASLQAVQVSEYVFARQWLLVNGEPIALTSNDRVNPCLAALNTLLDAMGIKQVSTCWVEYPDTNDGKALSTAAKAIEPRLHTALLAEGRIRDDSPIRAHVFLTPDRRAWIGVCDMRAAANEVCGIPRLRMPADAPSRSTLKLAEAIQFFLGNDAEELLTPEMRAVDLGAAPGGWTWQLVHRGLRVIAIDNGALKGELVDNALVKHLREDGFRYQPKVAVDWMVCDMVEQPSRIAKLVGTWLANDWARYIIFNLKLPMKKRHEELERCRDIILDALSESGRPLMLRFKQLYHDREEVTAFATLPSKRGREQFAAMAHQTFMASPQERQTRQTRTKGDSRSPQQENAPTPMSARAAALSKVFRTASSGGKGQKRQADQRTGAIPKTTEKNRTAKKPNTKTTLQGARGLGTAKQKRRR
jgi:23S rRNA (cytidine2498-2'-O)-methyltransferase